METREDAERRVCVFVCAFCHPKAPMSAQLLRTLCKAERLHCHSASGLCLLLDESSPKKGRKCFIFFHDHSSRACSSDYFWTIAISWQVPKRRRWPSHKNKLDAEVAACLSGEKKDVMPLMSYSKWCYHKLLVHYKMNIWDIGAFVNELTS